MSIPPPTTRPPARHGTGRRRPHRRGAVYLAVLGSSMLITLIGISAMLTNRAIHRAGETTHRATEARYLAHAAMELALQRMHTDPDWRSNHTHDQWTPARELGAGSVRYRLRAASSSNLANPADGHVYLEGEGRVGNALRRTRVALQPIHLLPGANLARNPDMADGTRFWQAGLPADRLEYTLAEAYRGDGSLRVSNRTGGGSQPTARQDVASWLESGRTYRVQLAVHLLNTPRSVELRFIVNGESVAAQPLAGLSTSNWSSRTVTLTPAWTGGIDAAWFEVHVDGPGDFLLDEVSLIPVEAMHRMAPVPGTWQQTVR